MAHLQQQQQMQLNYALHAKTALHKQLQFAERTAHLRLHPPHSVVQFHRSIDRSCKDVQDVERDRCPVRMFDSIGRSLCNRSIDCCCIRPLPQVGEQCFVSNDLASIAH